LFRTAEKQIGHDKRGDCVADAPAFEMSARASRQSAMKRSMDTENGGLSVEQARHGLHQAAHGAELALTRLHYREDWSKAAVP